jgi:hypothetical protein
VTADGFLRANTALGWLAWPVGELKKAWGRSIEAHMNRPGLG